MGYPKTENTERFQFMVSEKMIEDLKDFSRQTGIPMSELARRALKAYLRRVALKPVG